MIKISPSILSADFSRLGEETERVCRSGADYVHIDVMDGNFVPNITIGAPVVAAVRPHSSIPLDVHLMIEKPEKLLDDFIKAGAGIITVHAEATGMLDEIINRISAAGVKPSLSIKPGTPASVVFPYLERLAMVLVMTVEPGFGGQKLIEDTLIKVSEIKNECTRRGLNTEIEVDGGITSQNAGRAAAAGASVFVAGSAVFNSPDMAAAIAGIRAAAVACAPNSSIG